LHTVVTIALGHDADEIIATHIESIVTDSRKYLGLRLNNYLAIKLMKEAEGFYLSFIEKTGHPDILILHQVNEHIINHLQQVFAKYPVRFINMAKQTGNCGCATTGIVLHHLKNEIQNKKVMICSFGTGGVITAGLWQF
jgi:IMP cyclohydrolase